MKASDLRNKFLQFFKTKDHSIIESASLIPENDPTVLFTTAGMHPLIPYLLGAKHPAGRRLANVQKCIRTGDIESVGSAWHLTFFEMLGNWSLGDYFKEGAIEMSWQFLTDHKWLAIDPDKILVTVFAGDNNAPFDKEAYRLWQKRGIHDKKIFKYGKEENWWGPAGKTGPCGPDTEMYYDTGQTQCQNCQEIGVACNCGKYAEIWNDVFMEYNKNEDGSYEPLRQKNVDTGMGLERTAAILQGHDNVFETELFKPLIKRIESISERSYRENGQVTRQMRIIADHLKAATFILADDKGIVPSNLEQGYVLRRLIRRAIRYGKSLGIEQSFASLVALEVLDLYQDVYQELLRNKDFILDQLKQEEDKFKSTLAKGLRQFNKKEASALASDGKAAFDFFQTYGFPLEMYIEELKAKHVKVDEEKLKKQFDKEFKKHQDLSRQGSEQKFTSGLADHAVQTTRLHTAAHLMLAALRKVLGGHVYQKGSNITQQRLRFDFSHGEKMTDQQIKKVEDLVNEVIAKDLEVSCQEMTVDEAKDQKAMGIFEHKYGDKVKVYAVGDFSKEICAGPHVQRTSELGHFKIVKEQSSSAGVRRIKAVLE